MVWCCCYWRWWGGLCGHGGASRRSTCSLSKFSFEVNRGTFLFSSRRVSQSNRLTDSAAYLTAPVSHRYFRDIGVLLIMRGSASFFEETNHLGQPQSTALFQPCPIATCSLSSVGSPLQMDWITWIGLIASIFTCIQVTIWSFKEGVETPFKALVC